MDCMFPDLLKKYKAKHEGTGNDQSGVNDNATSVDTENVSLQSATLVIDALNLMEVTTNDVTDQSKVTSLKLHDNFEALDLFSTDKVFCELLNWRFQREKSLSQNRKSKLNAKNFKVDRSKLECKPVLRSKRIRKATAKKMASDNVEKSKFLNSLKKPTTKGGASKKHIPIDVKSDNTNSPVAVGKHEPVQCDICGRVVRKKRLESHKLLHTNNSKYTCETCGKVCGTKSDLQNHQLIHGEFNYQCEYCDQKFRQPAPYRTHLRMHTVPMNWMCNICFQTFNYQGELKKHCMEAHADISKSPQCCCVCKETLRSPLSVYRHSVSHTGVRTFECGVCGKKFKHKGHLEVC